MTSHVVVCGMMVCKLPGVGETERAGRLLINMQQSRTVVSESTSRVVHPGQDAEKHVVSACDACGWEHKSDVAHSDWTMLRLYFQESRLV